MQLAASANKAVAKISKLRKERKRKDSQVLILDSSPSDMTEGEGLGFSTKVFTGIPRASPSLDQNLRPLPFTSTQDYEKKSRAEPL